jgi:uncharacterized protein (TIGR03435 family)
MRFAALAFFAITAFAQLPSFEAAVIKPSLPPEQQKIFHNGVMIDKGHVDMGYQSLEDLIARAFRVSTFQISGPEWMKSARFDVDAKLPSDASDVHVPEMLQAMLAERFGMKAHQEDRPTAVYNLIVGKGGPKMPVADDAAKSAPPKRVSSGMTEFDFQMTMPALASFLTRMTPRPVFDQTGLTGKYRVAIDLPLVPAGQAAGAEDESSSIFTSVEQLGLKLDPQKEPLQTIVIDRLEKMPTGN